MSHVTGTHKGQDLHAFEVEIGFTAVACKRLGEAVLLAGLRVLNSHSLYTPPLHRHAVWLTVTVPADKVATTKVLMGDALWRMPARFAAGNTPPMPTWGELRDQVEALLATHKGPHLPCGHPVATLTFDAVDGARYTCPLCKQQQAKEGA